MDPKKIGRFIAACRKEQGFTQAALAERLGITDRAVSKWETGRSMPDASIMPALCGLLGINLNELFCGERLDMDEYKKMAEENLLRMLRQARLSEEGAHQGIKEAPGHGKPMIGSSLLFSNNRWQVSSLRCPGLRGARRCGRRPPPPR